MSETIKVLLVDDEVDTFFSKHKEDFCASMGVEVIKAHDVNEFKEHLDYTIDAVISDLNFSDESRHDLVGYMDVRTVVTEYKSHYKREIPLYVCSGNPELIPMVSRGEKTYEKTQFEDLITDVKNDVERRQTPEFRIRTRFSSQLKAVRVVLKQYEEELVNILLYCEKDNAEKKPEETISKIKWLRDRLEDIRRECRDLQIIPDLSLKNFSRFMSGNLGEYPVEYGAIMPRTLARSLWYLVDIINDVCHSLDQTDGKDAIVVQQYVRDEKENAGILLLETVTYIFLDICIWFNTYKSEHQNPEENRAIWDNGKTAYHSNRTNASSQRGSRVTIQNANNNSE